MDLAIQWAGGFVSNHVLVRPVARYDQLDNYPHLVARILQLRQQKQTAARIAEQLNREGYRPPKRRATFSGGMKRRERSASARQGERKSWPEGSYHIGQLRSP